LGKRLSSFFLLFAFFLALRVPPLYSQEADDGEPITQDTKTGIITSIEITGLKRTKPQTVRLLLEKFIGREGSELDPNEVQAALRDTMTLEPLAVELAETEDGFTLLVTVAEKWSIFPVPLVFVSSGGFNFGLFLADTNAFGQRDIAAVGGMYGSSGWLATLVYMHTPNRKGLPGWNTFFMYGRGEREDEDKNENIHRRYTADRLSASIGVSYPFTEYFSGSASVSFSDISLSDNSDTLNPPEDGVRLVGFSPNLSFRSSSWDGFLQSQRSISLGYKYNLAFSGSSHHEAEFRGVWEQPLLPGFRINLKSGGIWKSEADPGTDPLFEEGPHSAQVDILPQNFSARHYAGFSAGLEKYIFKGRWGTLSALASWQCVYSYGPISDFEFDHGPSGGIRFYLSRLALPAMGTGIAYNMNSGILQFAFSMGMQF